MASNISAKKAPILLLFMLFIKIAYSEKDRLSAFSPAEMHFKITAENIALTDQELYSQWLKTAELLRADPNSALEIYTYFQLARYSSALRQSDDHKRWLSQLHEYEGRRQDGLKQVLVLIARLHQHYYQNEFNEALLLAEDLTNKIDAVRQRDIIELHKLLKPHLDIEFIDTFKTLGKAYYLTGNYEAAQKYFIIALKRAELIDDKRLLSQLLNNLSVIYWAQNEVENALIYLERGLSLAKAMGDTKSYLSKLSNKGIYLAKLERNDESAQTLKTVLQHPEIGDYPKLKVNTLIALSELYATQNNIEQAKVIAEQALSINKEMDDLYSESNIKMVIGNLASASEEHPKAIDMLLEVVEFYEQKNLNKELSSALLSLSKSYQAIGDYQQSLKYFNQHHKIYIDLLQEAQNESVNELMAQYESDFKESQIKLLQQQNTIKSNQAKASQHKAQLTIIISLASIVILILLVIGIYSYREQKRLKIYNQEIKAREKQLMLLSSAFRSTSDGVWITDENFIIQEVNEAFIAITGRVNAIGKKMQFSNIKGQSKTFSDMVLSTLKNQGSWSGEVYDLNAEGKIYPIEIKIEAIRDSEGNVIHYLGAFRDISKRRQIEDELVKRTTQDELTGLPNRVMFSELIQRSLRSAERDEFTPAIYYIDINGFKAINDSLGRKMGDDVIKAVAERLATVLRNKDIMARLGDDEFGILAEVRGPKTKAATIAKNIIRAFHSPIEVNSSFYKVSLTIGITVYPDDALDAEELLRQSNIAMTASKSQGTSSFKFFRNEMNDAVKKSFELEQKLLKAIEQQEFVFYYQPIVSLSNDEVVGAEALIRWENAGGKTIFPDQFIPDAERLGLIVEIDKIVVDRVFRQVMQWNAAQFDISKIAINLSASIFSTPDILLELLNTKLQQYKVNPKCISIEITEGMLVENLETVKRTMRQLKALGFILAVDDFGTGFSSLNYLKEFPIDVLKVDKTFIMNMHESKKDKNIVRSIIELAHNLDFQVVAEGVEFEQHLNALKQMSCEQYQGYYFSRPVSASKFEEFVSKVEIAGNPL